MPRVKFKKKNNKPLFRREYKCEICKQLYIPKSHNSKYCSLECKREAYKRYSNNYYHRTKQTKKEDKEIEENLDKGWFIPGSQKEEALFIIKNKRDRRKEKYKDKFKEYNLLDSDIMRYSKDNFIDEEINDVPTQYVVDKIQLYRDLFTRLKLYPEQIKESERHKIIDDIKIVSEDIMLEEANTKRDNSTKDIRLDRATNENNYHDMELLIDVIKKF